jgi:homoserine dehydrogenase
VLGDVVSVMTGGARPPAPPLPLRLVEDVASAFYLHLDVADRPGVLASVTQVLGEHEISIRSVVQRGTGDSARLVMVTHPVLGSGLREAVEQVAEFDFMRAPPRMIRVIEEEFL